MDEGALRGDNTEEEGDEGGSLIFWSLDLTGFTDPRAVLHSRFGSGAVEDDA